MLLRKYKRRKVRVKLAQAELPIRAVIGYDSLGLQSLLSLCLQGCEIYLVFNIL